MERTSRLPILAVVICGLSASAPSGVGSASPTRSPSVANGAKMTFVDVTVAAGLAVDHRFNDGVSDIGMVPGPRAASPPAT